MPRWARGLGDLGLGAAKGGLRDIDIGLGHPAACLQGAGAVGVGLGLGQVRLGAGDGGGVLSDGAPGRGLRLGRVGQDGLGGVQGRRRLFDTLAVGAVIDLGQQLTRLDGLEILDRHLDHIAADLGADQGDLTAHIGVVGALDMAGEGRQLPGEQDDQNAQHGDADGDHGPQYALLGLGRRRRGWRCGWRSGGGGRRDGGGGGGCRSWVSLNRRRRRRRRGSGAWLAVWRAMRWACQRGRRWVRVTQAQPIAAITAMIRKDVIIGQHIGLLGHLTAEQRDALGILQGRVR